MQDITIDLHLTMITETDIDLTGQDPIPAVIDIGVTVRVINKEVTINETLHIEDPHHTEVIQHIPEIIADLDHVPCTKTPA